MGTPKDSEATRAKIIEAAGQLFAEKGFNGVTVRDIVKKAGTHLSALNYHFKTKEALYREVLLEACKIVSISLEEQRHLEQLEPREAMFLFVKESLKVYDKQRASNWQTVIITREYWEQGPIFGEVVHEFFKPEMDFIARIAGKIVDQPHDSIQVRFAVIGLFGLLDTFGLYGHLIDAIAPGLMEHGRKADWFAKQITHLVIEAANPSSQE